MSEGWERAKRAGECLGACEIEVGGGFSSFGQLASRCTAGLCRPAPTNQVWPREQTSEPPTSNSSLLRSFHDLLERRAKVRITSNRDTI